MLVLLWDNGSENGSNFSILRLQGHKGKKIEKNMEMIITGYMGYILLLSARSEFGARSTEVLQCFSHVEVMTPATNGYFQVTRYSTHIVADLRHARPWPHARGLHRIHCGDFADGMQRRRAQVRAGTGFKLVCLPHVLPAFCGAVVAWCQT